MTHLAVSDAGWTAIGTLALAVATVVAIIVSLALAVTDRRRADAQRLAEILRDDDRRAQDRERDASLRRETAEERERRDAAEQRSREDYEARQVIVNPKFWRDMPASNDPVKSSHVITVSTPHAYPIKQVDGRWVLTRSGNLSIVDFGYAADAPTVDDNRTYYTFLANIPSTDRSAEPIIRFVDWHGNLYYQYRHYTDRFPQNTDFHEAAAEIDAWVRTGPKPD